MADKVEQLEMLNENPTTQTGPVTCLGITFENDEARRAYFTEELRKKLPELRKIEGFPIGEDEEILALSDPPFYTACPNPWINDFVAYWNLNTTKSSNSEEYHREPLAKDISEGKNDPVYTAHTYHTKVPHKAIMRYILHYTEPGDIIFDGFSGSGMTGVAGNGCSDKDYLSTFTDDFHNIGDRLVILNDLSPVSAHISSGFNHLVFNDSVTNELRSLIDELENKHNWMYQTLHGPNNDKGTINYVIYSDVFICPECNNEINFWDSAVNRETGEVKEEFACSNCGVKVMKKDLEKSLEVKYDKINKVTYHQNKLVPVIINYSINGKRFEKVPDEHDFELLSKIDDVDIDSFIPNNDLIPGDEIGRLLKHYSKVYQLCSRRNLIVLSDFLEHAKKLSYQREALFLFTSVLPNLTWLYRWRANNKGGTTSGTYYICSTPQDNNPFNQLRRKLTDLTKIRPIGKYQNVIGVQSTTKLQLNDSSVDYIFTDPPFGSNLMYSELNYLWESWLRIFTNNASEAIVNNHQRKHNDEYKELMFQCFNEMFRILKPGKWMTVVFSNSKASVWNVIRESIEKAGFVIANVSALDKKQGSFKAVTTTTAVKQDLVISAYKPTDELRKRISNNQNTEDSAWSFVQYHLAQLPVFTGQKGFAEIIVERTPRILFDRMVAYHVQNGYSVPLSSGEFQVGIEQRFPMRDGMAFLESQVAEYDKKRILAKEFTQLSLFVSDENSAIEWLRQQLLKKPQTRQDLHPNFMKEIQHIAKHELLPELDELLEQNFLKYDGEGEVPSQIHAYLSSDYKDLRNLSKNDPKLKEKAKDRWYVPDPNKQADLEKLREKSLLREFNQYVEELSNNKKKLKQFRTEAIRVGFHKAWTEKDYKTIVEIGNRMPESILQEDEKLLRYYDNAQTKLGL
ncbi:DNA methyltransferase [Brevibacillus agri]|uniref:DNA methyltransferase n=1 Tax=Brevibacillus agri TaxID=51101 RepID=UPI001C8DF59C|nr:DNA methyltransferase [Brevibacillus agri]MBY0050948.1 DNA methylase [Brevibacillus agri]